MFQNDEQKVAKSCENNKQAKDGIVQNNKPQYLVLFIL